MTDAQGDVRCRSGGGRTTEYSEVLAEMDDEDDRVLNALWAQAKATMVLK